MAHNVDPYLTTCKDPVPMLQIFGEIYRDGRLPPCHKPVKARTVKDRICAAGQSHARLGPPDPRKDTHGGIDLHIQCQIKAYKKDDAPPLHVKPVPIIIIIFIVAQAYGNMCDVVEMAIADIIFVAFFILLHPGEYTDALSCNVHSRSVAVSITTAGRNHPEVNRSGVRCPLCVS
jgi:hypothetical protein